MVSPALFVQEPGPRSPQLGGSVAGNRCLRIGLHGVSRQS
jgi:hypothetical protein